MWKDHFYYLEAVKASIYALGFIKWSSIYIDCASTSVRNWLLFQLKIKFLNKAVETIEEKLKWISWSYEIKDNAVQYARLWPFELCKFLARGFSCKPDVTSTHLSQGSNCFWVGY